MKTKLTLIAILGILAVSTSCTPKATETQESSTKDSVTATTPDTTTVPKDTVQSH